MVNQFMISSLYLHFAGILLSYSLQVGVAYGTGRLLSRLLRTPQQRFVLWMVFLLGAGTYWLGLIGFEARALLVPPAGSDALPAGSPASLVHPLLIPPSWGPGVVIAGEAVALGYLGALVLLLGLAGWRHIQLRLILRRGVEPSTALAGLFRATCRDFGLFGSRLLILPGLQSPATACWWRPRVLLPEVCEDLGPTPQLADVLHHELVHVARRDYFWAGISDLICRLLFFHPAVWLARQHLRLEGELACDMAVVEARPGQRDDYASSLAYFVRLRMVEEGISLGVDFAAAASTLGIRIRNILTPPQPLPWWKRASQTIAALALVTAMAVLFPLLNILLDFARPSLVETVLQEPTPLSAPPVRHHIPRRTPARQNGTSAPSQDSLTRLPTQPRVRETPAYAMTATANGRPDAEPGELDRGGWKDPDPPVRTVSSVVLATVRQIPVGRIPRGRDRDHDGDDH